MMKMEIILLRHGRPVFPSFNKITPASFIDWVTIYNRSGLCFTAKPTDEALYISSQRKAVVCSELPRSIASAKALKINEVILTFGDFSDTLQ